MLRITGGRFRGRKLLSLRGDDVRPSGARLREAVFNILGDLEGTRGIDLCCGAGTMGLEALSRGAAHVVFVDWSPASLRLVRKNLATLEADDRATVVRADVLRRLHTPPSASPLGWVYVDPPWSYWERAGSRRAIADRLVEVVGEAGAGGPPELLAEHRGNVTPFEGESRLRVDQTRTFGDAAVTFLRANPDPSGNPDGTNVNER